jgi:hypothetical protein
MSDDGIVLDRVMRAVQDVERGELLIDLDAVDLGREMDPKNWTTG